MVNYEQHLEHYLEGEMWDMIEYDNLTNREKESIKDTLSFQLFVARQELKILGYKLWGAL